MISSLSDKQSSLITQSRILAQQASLPLKASSSAFVAPRPSAFYHERFSSSSASTGGPMRNIPGDANHVLLHGFHGRNPALLISHSAWSSISDSTSISDTTIHSFQGSGICLIIKRKGTITRYQLNRRGKLLLVEASSQRLNIQGKTTSINLVSESTSKGSSRPVRHVRTCIATVSRSLLVYISNSNPPFMITSVSVPGTPPELTESQSSKSSSYGSRISSPEEFAGRNMNFEEIDLEDEHHADKSHHILERSGSRESVKRDYTVAKRPALATLQTRENRHLRLVENGTKSATTPATKRYFSSPTIPAADPKQLARTRSVSPALHQVPSSSRIGQFAQMPATSLAIPGRRGSWQPARKTIYEIEAEYHDSDDELPDDASLFNVPISPFPSHPRSAPRSAFSSAQGSPEREAGALSPGPLPLAHARTNPDAPSKQRVGSKPSTRQKPGARTMSANLAQSKSASTSPRTDRLARTKSWNLVMADLDYEARIIAEKLDFHQEAAARSANSPANSFRASAPGAIPLPPIQRGTLDFMPMSKEKEAVLSRTRPSWLPPKDPREERKHLLEYQKMMRASIDAEKKREERLKNMQNAKEETHGSLRRIWTFYTDPSTDLTKIDRRVNDLCWRGLPSNLRGRVWQRTVGNSLGLTEDMFLLAKERVQEIKSRPAEEMSEHEKRMHRCFIDIERDAETAFPDTSIFVKGGPQHKDLIDVCEAYTSYRADTGYFYGLQLIAGLLLLQLPKPADAFILLANCLKRTMPLAFQTGETEATARAYSKVQSTLDIKFPRLHSYLFNSEEQGGLGFTGEELLETMFCTLFANGLDLERLCRVWDIWIFESDRYLIRTAVALLGAMQTQIFDIQGDIHLRRRNIQEMLGWGPFNRGNNGYWKFDIPGNGDSFVEDIRQAGRLDTAGR